MSLSDFYSGFGQGLDAGNVVGNYGEFPNSPTPTTFNPNPFTGLSAFADFPIGQDAPDSRLLSEPPNIGGVGGFDTGAPNQTGYATSTNLPTIVNGKSGSYDITGFFTPDGQQGPGLVKLGDTTGIAPYAPSTLPKSQQYAAIQAQGNSDAFSAGIKSFTDSVGQSVSNIAGVSATVSKTILLLGGLAIAAYLVVKLKG